MGFLDVINHLQRAEASLSSVFPHDLEGSSGYMVESERSHEVHRDCTMGICLRGANCRVRGYP